MTGRTATPSLLKKGRSIAAFQRRAVLGAMAPYWFISECPFAIECSKPAWAKCESEEQCREFLHQRICRS